MLCYVEVGGLLWTTLDEVKKRIVLTSNFVTNTYSQASPGTHFVKNHDSLSLTNKSQLKKKNKQTRSPKFKMLRPLCNQTVNMETYAKLFITVFWN